MSYDFDKIIDRTNTHSIKYDFKKFFGKDEDILPLWVADMDFKTAPEILTALEESVHHGIFGYSDVTEDYFQALKTWLLNHHNWEVKHEWLVKVPGVVFALTTAIEAYSEKGDSILVQQPVYYPFFQTILKKERNLVVNSLVLKDGKYSIDFEQFEQDIVTNQVKVFLLCNPHNPVGRVWTYEELVKLGTICLKHNVFVVSDEIHADFVYTGHKHTVFASISPEFAQNSIICTAPSKTFNLAGLQVSNIFIPDRARKKAMKEAMGQTGYHSLNGLGIVACQAAYEHGEAWYQELMKYLYGNLSYVREFIKTQLPKLTLIEPEGTYLIWIDFREYGLPDKELDQFLEKNAKLWLDAGTMFGKEGSGFQRMNIACPRKILEKAMEQLKEALLQLE